MGLRCAVSRLSTECPTELRQDAVARRAWAQEHGLTLVPFSIDQRKGSRVRLLWADAATGAAVPDVALWSSATMVKDLGPRVALGKATRRSEANISPIKQRSLFEFMVPTA